MDVLVNPVKDKMQIVQVIILDFVETKITSLIQVVGE